MVKIKPTTMVSYYLREFTRFPNLHISNIFEITNALIALLLIIVAIFTLNIFFYTLKRFVRPYFNQIYLLLPNGFKFIFKSMYFNFVIFYKSKLFQGIARLIVLVILQTSIPECVTPSSDSSSPPSPIFSDSSRSSLGSVFTFGGIESTESNRSVTSSPSPVTLPSSPVMDVPISVLDPTALLLNYARSVLAPANLSISVLDPTIPVLHPLNILNHTIHQHLINESDSMGPIGREGFRHFLAYGQPISGDFTSPTYYQNLRAAADLVRPYGRLYFCADPLPLNATWQDIITRDRALGRR